MRHLLPHEVLQVFLNSLGPFASSPQSVAAFVFIDVCNMNWLCVFHIARFNRLFDSSYSHLMSGLIPVAVLAPEYGGTVLELLMYQLGVSQICVLVPVAVLHFLWSFTYKQEWALLESWHGHVPSLHGFEKLYANFLGFFAVCASSILQFKGIHSYNVRRKGKSENTW